MKDYEILRDLRIKNNLSQTELAKKLGVSYPSYRRYEKGERPMKLDFIIKTADYFKVPVTYINPNLTIDVVNALGNKGYVITEQNNPSETISVSSAEFEAVKDFLGILKKYDEK